MNWMQLTMLAAALNTQIPTTAGLITCRKHDHSYLATAGIKFENPTRHVTNFTLISQGNMSHLH